MHKRWVTQLCLSVIVFFVTRKTHNHFNLLNLSVHYLDFSKKESMQKSASRPLVLILFATCVCFPTPV